MHTPTTNSSVATSACTTFGGRGRTVLLGLLLIALPVVALSDDTPAAKPDRAALLKTFRSEFVPITPGRGKFPKSFTMGTVAGPESERPPVEVTFEYDFAIAKYEVPQNLYEAVTGENPSRWKGPRNSVEMMTRAEAITFCEKATKLLREAKRIEADEVVRLPTEAEWEYCARAGTKTAYSFGNEARKEGDEDKQASLLDPYAWHTGNAAGNDPPVGALKPNPWGLYDVHGYLWEFVVDDWFDGHDHNPGDGSAMKLIGDEPDVVARGGSWRDRYERLTSSSRAPFAADDKGPDLGFRCVLATVPKDERKPRYSFREEHDPNGIGKFYMGREIAHVMGWQGADWLERPTRNKEEDLDNLVKSLKLKPGMVVADIGAGSGVISVLMAKRLDEGKVVAVDIQDEMLTLLGKKLEQLKVENVEPHKGAIKSPNLKPGSIDVALMVDVYHEFSFPHEMTAEIVKALKPGGRIALVEYRKEDPKVPIKLVHKMTEAQCKKELGQPEFGLRWVETIDVLPRQHIVVFQRKPAGE